MKINYRDFAVGLIVLLSIIAFIAFLRNNPQGTQNNISPISSPSQELIDKIEDKFKLTLPSDATTYELKDATTDSYEYSGLVTKSKENDLNIITILADLPDTKEGVYTAWLVNDSGEKTKIGNLRIAKGGYLYDYETKEDISKYKEVVVSLEKNNDNAPEKILLTGSLKD